MKHKVDEKFEKEFEKAKSFFKEKNFVVTDTTLKSALACKKLGYPLLLVGPTGSGKTLFLSLLAEYYQGKYDYQSLNGSITIHDLTQERILDKNGAFKENDMVLAKWLRQSQKGVSIMHLDEINAARPETLLALHPIMDLKGELVLPYSDEILKVTKNAILVMSANEGDEYNGINAMNMAFQNRFIKVHLPYIQGEDLVNVLVAKTFVDRTAATKIANVWTKYMESRDVEQPVISIRLLERWCDMSQYLGLREAGKVTFASLIAKDEEELNSIVEGDFFVNLQ